MERPRPKTLLSQVEFLEFERKSEERHEYYKGLYRDIPSLKEYITLDSTKIHVEQFVNNGDKTWTLSEFKNLAD